MQPPSSPAAGGLLRRAPRGLTLRRLLGSGLLRRRLLLRDLLAGRLLRRDGTRRRRLARGGGLACGRGPSRRRGRACRCRPGGRGAATRRALRLGLDLRLFCRRLRRLRACDRTTRALEPCEVGPQRGDQLAAVCCGTAYGEAVPRDDVEVGQLDAVVCLGHAQNLNGAQLRIAVELTAVSLSERRWTFPTYRAGDTACVATLLPHPA